MDVVATVINAVVVAAVGVILAWLGKGRLEGLDRGIDRLETRLDQRIDGLENRLETRIDSRTDGLQASIDALRSDLTQIALAVGARDRATNA